jgi:hypothetical protein
MQNNIEDWSNDYDTIEDVRKDIFDVTYDLEEDEEYFFIYKDKFYTAYKIEDEDGDDEYEYREVTKEYVDENTNTSPERESEIKNFVKKLTTKERLLVRQLLKGY